MNYAVLLDQQAARRPDDEALVCDGRSRTFAEAAAETRALARGLAALGVGRGDRVAVLAPNLAEYVLLTFAAYRLGAVVVPLNYRLAAGELAVLLARTRPVVLACGRGLVDRATEACAGRSSVTARIVLDPSGAVPDGWLPYPEVLADGDTTGPVPTPASALQRVMFTSGTSGRPKGVLITHGMAAVNALTQALVLDVRPGDRILITAPLHHVGGADLPGIGAWSRGATLVLQPRFDPDEALEIIRRERITGTTMVATMLHALRARAGGRPWTGLALRWVLFGVLPVEVCRELAAVLPGVRLVRGYGMTETMGGVSYLDDVTADPQRAATVGWPVPFVQVRTVDPTGRPTRPGEPGEIVVRGDKVTPGYWEAPDDTAAAIRDGWLRTGDVGVIGPDGALRVTDRIKDLIRSGGENISSAEIEEVLYAHPAVAEAAVVAMPHERWVEVPKAYVVRKAAEVTAEVTADQLIAHCRAVLAGFKVPAAVEFVEALPRNSTGKVDKARLRGSGG